jgi:hypothetical protein
MNGWYQKESPGESILVRARIHPIRRHAGYEACWMRARASAQATPAINPCVSCGQAKAGTCFKKNIRKEKGTVSGGIDDFFRKAFWNTCTTRKRSEFPMDWRSGNAT